KESIINRLYYLILNILPNYLILFIFIDYLGHFFLF
ncbi:putative membrane protein, partial [Yersinia pestis PY-113]